MGVDRLPSQFRQTADPLRINLDYQDSVSGEGVIQFFGYSTENSGATTYHLLNQSTVYSNDIETTSIVSGATFFKHLDLDFNTPAFDKSQVLEGTAYVSIPLGTQGADADTTRSNAYVIPKLKKVVGATETIIVESWSETLTSEAALVEPPVDGVKSVTMAMTVPRTAFNVGDVLRLTVEGWAKTTDGTDQPPNGIIIGHSPANSKGPILQPASAPGLTNVMSLFVPFKVDV